MRKTNYGINLLKILACLGVILLHVSSRYIKGSDDAVIYQFFYYFGTISIPLFFMINGYFILNKIKLTYNYLINKIKNILIIILLWNTVYSIAYLVIKKEFKNPFLETFSSLIQDGFFFQFWFLGTLIVLLSSAKILNTLLNKYFKTYTGVLIGLLILSISIDLYNHISGTDPIQKGIIQTFRLWTWYLYYMLGGFFGKSQIKEKIKVKANSLKYKVYTVFFGISVIIYEILNSKWINNIYAEYNYDSILVIMLTILVFNWFQFLDSKKYNKFIDTVSPNIMGIFIIHTIVIKVTTRLFSEITVFGYFGELISVILISLFIVRIIRLTKQGDFITNL